MKKKVILYRDIPVEERQRLDEQFNVTFFNGIHEDNNKAFKAAPCRRRRLNRHQHEDECRTIEPCS